MSTVTSAAVDRLPAVGLDELVGTAALLTRVDRKYLLPAEDLEVLLSSTGPGTRVLEIDGRRRFDYRSVYFDTPELHSYHATARRRRHRFKVRTRSYLDAGLHVLEVKTRGPRGLTVKQRLPHAGDGTALDDADRDRLGPLLASLGLQVDAAALGPVLTTRYHRTTLLLPTGSSRLTVDTGLVWSLAGTGRAGATTGRAVIETKSGCGTSEVDRLLWSLGRRPSAISKYGTGLAALRPDLPANRWQSVLRRHLVPTLLTESEPT
ncbi:VTC domain-containing protein [Friedmanniella luteola]|uniref:VTC domain-containing protein n=1 Tax=Friedmanniella luteola TaxID=546871 RepID=A0A1H1LAX7_9ACTN|nr:polyphosphate polymerase domain-containing protein [Friedmanniella luteola]SDR71472.1 VTC domain-containing protein [Friedmanniella luteola]